MLDLLGHTTSADARKLDILRLGDLLSDKTMIKNIKYGKENVRVKFE